ncbi:MAG: hypothetical protein U9N59_02475 [Campylobacterota bacterium]|nr:hypothetical protein [Campylobacterota bacterium]
MKKVIFLLLISIGFMFAKAPVYKVIMSEEVPAGYEKDVYKKSIVLMTEGRLYLQKKYKKKITFEYQKKLIKSKDDILKELKKQDARFYVYLSINKKKSKKNLQKVLYNLNIVDLKTKKKKTVKTKAIIRDTKIVKISQGDVKSSAKKIAKILKKK